MQQSLRNSLCVFVCVSQFHLTAIENRVSYGASYLPQGIGYRFQVLDQTLSLVNFVFVSFFFSNSNFTSFNFISSIFTFYFWLCWVFASVQGLSPVAASRGHSSSQCAGLSPSRPLPLRSTGSRRAGSVIVAHGPSRSAARGILPDQGLNPRPLHWQADSQPLRHQGSPNFVFELNNLNFAGFHFLNCKTRSLK